MPSYQVIKHKIEVLEKAAQIARKKESASVIKTIHAMMREYGITLADLRTKSVRSGSTAAGKAARKTVRKTKTAAKYRNPETGETWSGRGKPPNWMAGPRKDGTADQFLIANPSPAKASTKSKKTARKKTATAAPARKTPAKRQAKRQTAAAAKSDSAAKAAGKKAATATPTPTQTSASEQGAN